MDTPHRPSDELHHKAHCSAADVYTYRGAQGDVMARCRSCRAVTSVTPSFIGSLRNDTHDESTPTPKPTSRYLIACARCGTMQAHHDPRPAVRMCRGCKPSPRAHAHAHPHTN